MDELMEEARREVIEAKLETWRKGYYDFTLDAKIGETLEDPRLQKQAQENMKRALKVISALEKMLEELPAI